MRSCEQAAKASLISDDFSPVGTTGSGFCCLDQGLEAKDGGNGVDVGGELTVAAAEAEAAVEGRVFGGVLECFDAEELARGWLEAEAKADAQELGTDVAAEELRREFFAELFAVGEGRAGEVLERLAIGNGSEAFEEVVPGVEAIHFAGLVGFVVERFGVVLKGEGEKVLVEIEEMSVGEGFAEVAPGESGLQLKSAGHAGPPDGVVFGAFAGQKDDGVEALESAEIPLHGEADFTGASEINLLSREAMEPEEGAGDDAAVEEIAVTTGGGELKGHRPGVGVPSGVSEKVCRQTGCVEEAGVARFFKEVTKAGDGVAGDFG